MNIIELKNQIENKTLGDSFLILKYTEIPFIATQYVEAISAFKNRPIVYVDSIDTLSIDIFGEDNNLYVMKTEKIDKPFLSKSLNNKIVICKSIDEDVLENMKQYVVDIPKIEQWQIRAFTAKNLPGLSAEEINWLIDTSKDIYRLSNEIDKIKIFSQKEQGQIFNLLSDEDSFSDLTSNTIFNLTNAITKRDVNSIRKVLYDINAMDVEPMGLLTILYRSFKNIIDIQMTANATAESLGMNPKQFNAIRYNLGKFNNAELISIFDTITLIDYQLKSGNIPSNNIIDYLLVKIV